MHEPTAVDNRPLVLLVDDEPANLQVLVEALRSSYRLKIARDGSAALALVQGMARRGAPPDLVVLDVLMPGMDGFAVCREIKINPLTSNLPVVFVTLVADSSTELERMQFDAVDYIVKPVNPAALRMRVRNLVQLKRLQDQFADIATHDQLTGLANKRRFGSFLTDEWRRCQRSHSPLALLRINVDRLGHFNEHYNTPSGDAALRRIAEVLGSHQRRPGDLAARLDGDNFALALAATDAVGALAVAESVRRGVELLAILHAGSGPGVISVSCGVSVTRGDTPLHELLAHAGEQLAKAKHSGRNRVAIQPIL